jgi:hypothetical protein
VRHGGIPAGRELKIGINIQEYFGGDPGWRGFRGVYN